jgi:signal transduction histidine kinase/ActR/RegA family two-component response regulator
MSHSIRQPVAQYGLAAACVGLAAGVTWALWESMYSSFVPLFVVAVALAAWFGGPRAGLAAAALAAGAVVAFLTLKPTPTPYTTADLLWAGSLMAAVVFAAWLNAARRHAEQMLQERDTRLRLVSEQIPAGLWSTDTGLRLTSRFGSGTFAPQATPGVTLLEVFPGQSSDYPPIAAHLRALRGEPSTFEMEWDGRTYQAHVEPLFNVEGRIVGVVGVASDISDRKRDERRLAEAKAEAEQATRAKDRFLAMLSHELRTPLTPALAAATAMERRSDLPAEVREDLQMVRRNIELEAMLIDDLLDLTRVARGKLELALRTADAHEVVRDAIDICRPDLEDKEIELVLDLAADRHHVRADGPRLQQVFWNLLKNAIKFTPQGGRIVVSTRNAGGGGGSSGVVERSSGGVQEEAARRNPTPLLHHSTTQPIPRPDNEGLIIEVRDTGVGIDPEVLPRIFDAFEQGGAATTRQFGGLGLGLSISKMLVLAHGGRLSAESEGRGKGATFRVELETASRAESQEAGHAAPAGGAADAASKPIRILLVEDHPDTLRLLSRLMRGLGHEVATADTVAGGLSAAEGWSADGRPLELLVSDLALPDGSGIDLLRQIKRRLAETGGEPPRAIVLTGHGMDDDIRRCREAGFDLHLTKPINFDLLAEALGQTAAV